ncbi:hypothetical protein SAMN05216338_101732 [Bradyrhizobium sp. Rc2d]|nr:hypothetical protein SAMN05216338_101732 [Bradyrhizobium sp. Rc2d]
MVSKNGVSPLAIPPRRRVVTTADVYGTSLTVRFISGAGDGWLPRGSESVVQTSSMLNCSSQP